MGKPLAVGVILALMSVPLLAQSISQNYPGDAGIENNPNVIFVERFDEATIADLVARWSDAGDQASLSFDPDVPPGSPVNHSLRMSSSAASSGSLLYKMLSPGIDTTLYLRYYAQYPAGDPGGSGRMGGYNPATPWPQGNLTGKPTGSDVFFTWVSAYSPTLEALLQAGWMGMHPDGAGGYWANQLVPGVNPQLAAARWTCFEAMIQLNSPVTSLNGKLTLWIDGVKANDLGLGFPNGVWSSATFTTDPAGAPFEGFQWRSDPALNINWIELLHYLPGTVGYTKFAHLVAGTSYIGPMVPAIPAAPANLTATAGDGQVTLSWSTSAGAASYQVLRSATPGGPYTVVATGVTSTSTTNAGLTNGTTYYYVVQAVNSGGQSPYSNEAFATPAPPPPPNSRARHGLARCGCGTVEPGDEVRISGWALLAVALLFLRRCRSPGEQKGQSSFRTHG